MFSKASLSGWLQRRCQVIPFAGLFFSGFLEEIGTAAGGAVTGVTTARGSVGRPIAVVARVVGDKIIGDIDMQYCMYTILH